MADVKIIFNGSNGVNGDKVKGCINCRDEEILAGDFPCIDCISLSRWTDRHLVIEDNTPNEIDIEEFPQRCDNCKYSLMNSLELPCLECEFDSSSSLSKWEQEESIATVENTVEKSCNNCKYHDLVGGRFCANCRRNGTGSHWESIEEVRPRSCGSCQYGDRHVFDMQKNPRECYMCYGTELKKNWKDKEKNMDVKIIDHITGYMNQFTDSDRMFDTSVFDNYIRGIKKDEGVEEDYSIINKEYFPDKIDERLMKRIMKDLALRKDLELQLKEYKDMEGLYLSEIEELVSSKKILADRVETLEQTLKDADISTCEMLWEG